MTRSESEIYSYNIELLSETQRHIGGASNYTMKIVLGEMVSRLREANLEKGLCSQIEIQGDYCLSSALLRIGFAHWGADRKDLCLVYPLPGGELVYDHFVYNEKKTKLLGITQQRYEQSRYCLKAFLIEAFTKQLTMRRAI